MRERFQRLPRRQFLASGCLAAGLAGAGRVRAAAPPGASVRDLLAPYVVPRETIDRFLDPKARVWARFDPELGYLLRNSFVRDGMDGCHTLARYEPTGQRQQINFPDQPCRINTYGDSFTQGHQVSDGETWQEILAAHFCEPIRNFGIGGFGVYQAYRRLLRTEPTDLGAKHLILNIWGDDHYRSVYSWRWLVFPPEVVATMNGLMFHSNPWVHARLSERGELVDRPNLCPDEATLKRLCDLDWLEATFQDDEIVHLLFSSRTGEVLSRDRIDRAATACGFDRVDLTSPGTVKATTSALLHHYAITVGMRIVERLDDYCRAQGKKLLILLSYPASSVWHACNGSAPGTSDNFDWHPASFKEFLASRKIPFVDSLPKHVAEFETFKLTPKQYVDRYYIGHYTPRGNHFFAYAIKDEILRWLDTPPPAYRNDDEPLIRFKGYLPG